ncbi:HD domain-containing protein [Bdellovibrio bacteriovorus]|uniref:HD domain-containing protein n=1 Tax=Bdellovibrio bacteriovorus TaxID=959 RepID=UPI0035A745D8
MAILGSMNWAKKTQGLMSMTDKLRMIQGIVRSELATLAGRHRAPAPMPDLQWPDTAIVKEILSECSELYSAPLLAHVLRTYYWGAGLAHADGKKVDLETFALASMLHDLGLCQTHLAKAACQCFAYTGAQVAETLLTKHQIEKRQQDVILEAIVAHLNPYLPENNFSSEAVYLSYGAFLDVTGKQANKLNPAFIEFVHGEHLRNGFLTDILETMKSPHHPSSRSGFMNKAFQKMVSTNDLNRYEAPPALASTSSKGFSPDPGNGPR